MSPYAPLPVHLARDLAEGRDMAGPRLLLWAVVLSRLVEGREPLPLRKLAKLVGASHAWVHGEQQDIRAWLTSNEGREAMDTARGVQ